MAGSRRRGFGPAHVAALTVWASTVACSSVGTEELALAAGGGLAGDEEATTDEATDDDEQPDDDPRADAGDDEPETPAPPSARLGDDPPLDPGCGDGSRTVALVAGDGDALGTPAMVRASVLGAGGGVPAVDVAARPFLNYYRFATPPAPAGDLTAELDLWEVEKGPSDRFRLQVSIASPTMDSNTRPPLHLALVFDLGALANAPQRALTKAGVEAIASALRAGDHVTAIVAADPPELLLERRAIVGIEDPTLTELAEQLDGLQLAAAEPDLAVTLASAYDQTSQYESAGVSSRVVFFSGGGQAASLEALEIVASHTELAYGDGTDLVGVGVGPVEGYVSGRVEELARAGGGSSIFLADAGDAARELGERLINHAVTSARDLEVVITLPTGVAFAEPDDGELGYAPAAVRLGPDDVLVFHEDLTACGEVDAPTDFAIALAWRDGASGAERQLELPVSLLPLPGAEQPARMHKGAAVVAYAEAVAAVQAGAADQGSALFRADAILEVAREVAPDDPELEEMAEILQQLAVQ